MIIDILKLMLAFLCLVFIMALFLPAISTLIEDVITEGSFFHKFALCCMSLIFIAGIIKMVLRQSKNESKKKNEDS